MHWLCNAAENKWGGAANFTCEASRARYGHETREHHYRVACVFSRTTATYAVGLAACFDNIDLRRKQLGM